MWLQEDPDAHMLPYRVNFQVAMLYSVPALPNQVAANEACLSDDLEFFVDAARLFLTVNGTRPLYSFWITLNAERPALIYVNSLAGELCMRIVRERNLAAVQNRPAKTAGAYELLQALCQDVPADVQALMDASEVADDHIGAPVNRMALNVVRNLVDRQTAEKILAEYFKTAHAYLQALLPRVPNFLGLEVMRVKNEHAALGVAEGGPRPAEACQQIIRRSVVEDAGELAALLYPLYARFCVDQDPENAEHYTALYGEPADAAAQPHWFCDRGYANVCGELVRAKQGWKHWFTLEGLALLLCLRQ